MNHLSKTSAKILKLWIAFFIGFVPLHGSAQQQTINTETPPRITEFMGNQPMTRVGRPFVVLASFFNPAKSQVNFIATLQTPDGIHIEGKAEQSISLAPNGKETIYWKLLANKPLYEKLLLKISEGNAVLAASELPVRFLAKLQERKLPYIPEPQKINKNSKLLVGAHYFPGWEKGRPEMWSQLFKHPERTPALDFNDQGNPEIADWETKWAAEHGIDFFIYCWYRTSQGGPVEQMLGSAIDARNKSRFKNQMKFTIMWENQNKGKAGVANEADLMNNLLPFWIENYFKRQNYLKIDNKPVLYIYRPEFLVDDLGGIEQVRSAFQKMRQACKDAGFDGLWLLGEYRGSDEKHLELMKSLGLDYTFAYCWYVGNSPNPQTAIDDQLKQIHKTQELNIIPQVVTISQGWSGWEDEGSIWAIPPVEFEGLLRQAKAFVGTLPQDQLSGKMLLLDNWNEWGEGHYLEPNTEYGFGYLDAIRKVFSDAPIKHQDLIPEDIGMGNYGAAFREWLAKKREK